ncbi:LAETG motif-containing sortase-dependent surface protein [Streptomyces sp. NPDC058257]|uniref:LAETG motif-containing sortase-dependent surface protein n=1 Tax=Streptomyces sp. NPDC058257 TaxID=3346409 RepID=UPI0036E32D37
MKTNSAQPTAAQGSDLADTGTNDNTAASTGAAAALVVAGGGTTVAVRRRKARGDLPVRHAASVPWAMVSRGPWCEKGQVNEVEHRLTGLTGLAHPDTAPDSREPLRPGGASSMRALMRLVAWPTAGRRPGVRGACLPRWQCVLLRCYSG